MPLFRKKRIHFNKRFWMFTGVTIIALVAGYFGKSYYDTYHDRPLAKGLQYIGRYYNSPCFFGQCYGPTTEAYYYATDIKPQDVVKLFPGWKVDKAIATKSGIGRDSIISSIGYNLVRTKTGTSSFYRYIADKEKVTEEKHLLSSDKRYIIEIWSEDSNGYDNYSVLRQ